MVYTDIYDERDQLSARLHFLEEQIKDLVRDVCSDHPEYLNLEPQWQLLMIAKEFECRTLKHEKEIPRKN